MTIGGSDPVLDNVVCPGSETGLRARVTSSTKRAAVFNVGPGRGENPDGGCEVLDRAVERQDHLGRRMHHERPVGGAMEMSWLCRRGGL